MDSTDKTYGVVISQAAAEMLVSHARFAALVSAEASQSLIEEFEEKTKSLETFPERNPWLNDPLVPKRKYRKLLMAKRYLLVYQIKGSIVYADAMVDCRQDYSWLL